MMNCQAIVLLLGKTLSSSALSAFRVVSSIICGKKNTLQGKTHIYARQKSLYCATLKKGNSDIHENDLICIFHLSDLLLTMRGICSGILLFWGILVYYKVTYYLIITSCISTKMVTLWELSQQEVTPIRDF